MPFARQPRGPHPDEAQARARLEQLLARPPAARAADDPWLDPVEGAGPADAPDPGAPDPADRYDRVSAGRHRAAEDLPPRPPVLTVPRSLRTARFSVRPAAVLGMLAVLLAAGAIFGLRVWQAGAAGTPQPVPVVAPTSQGGDAAQVTSDAGAAPGPGDPRVGATAAEAGATSAPVTVVVHVSGAVHRPGVVELPAGARVAEAVAAAGGLRGEADQDRLNLARTVGDGERVWVPVAGEDEPEVVGPAGSVAPSGTQDGFAGDTPAGPVVDLNAADQTALEELPGVGPVTAGRIVAWREEHGRFSSAEELLEVAGIGERTLEQLRPHLTW